jgi:hypothetical protein
MRDFANQIIKYGTFIALSSVYYGKITYSKYTQNTQK